MTYAALKLIHVLSLLVWVGGMLFVHCFLRPALRVLPGEQALVLMHQVLRRFFMAVAPAAALVLLSGVWMTGRSAGMAARAGLRFEMPWSWTLMMVLGMLMVLVFAGVRLGPDRRLARAVIRQDWAAAAPALAQIRHWMVFNLALGLIIIVIVVLA